MGKKTYTFFMLGDFWRDGGGLELFTIKFASEIVEYPISITCGVGSAQLSHSATTLCCVEEMTCPR